MKADQSQTNTVGVKNIRAPERRLSQVGRFEVLILSVKSGYPSAALHLFRKVFFCLHVRQRIKRKCGCSRMPFDLHMWGRNAGETVEWSLKGDSVRPIILKR